MSRLKGRIAIVTGASRGLGREIARAYAAEGASVALCARASSPTGLAGTVEEEAQRIRDEGGEALAVACDVADEGQVGAMVEQVAGHYGRIDILVNNAGLMIPSEPFLDIDPERWEQSMTVNVRGPYLTSRYTVPVMMKQGEGRIINVGSGAAVNHRAGGTVYCSSKAALHLFSLCLAAELKEHEIAVNILDPGPMKSEGSSVIPWTQHDWHERGSRRRRRLPARWPWPSRTTGRSPASLCVPGSWVRLGTGRSVTSGLESGTNPERTVWRPRPLKA